MDLILYGIVGAAAFTAWKANSLTSSGAGAALIVGTLSAAAFHWTGLLVLGAFFIPAVLLEKFLKVNDKVEEKGSKRDALQVLANGGPSGLAAMLFLLYPHPAFLGGFITGFAAAAADTWASTIGKRSKKQPKRIFTSQSAAKGISGGVTTAGHAAAFAGSGITVLAAYITHDTGLSLWLLTTFVVVGFSGQIGDAWMGDRWQSLYQCNVCCAVTEKTQHCGEKPVLIKGKTFISNDIVNLVTVFLAAVLGGIITMLFT
ncbi:DUF92 domain-containing protein [Alkalicoccus daliensis]|uniref:TIGR00297 family protein n=1 Tax=Alkalicoccus daliensis TaxID=745820 RepID=A0A1H0B851_9BACI|nr:DUF92 domain-containing protein [Alkalicoccus daliensis]SDN41845.1 TIGR00297 family protein [Alkalicoccus daliensis]